MTEENKVYAIECETCHKELIWDTDKQALYKRAYDLGWVKLREHWFCTRECFATYLKTRKR